MCTAAGAPPNRGARIVHGRLLNMSLFSPVSPGSCTRRGFVSLAVAVLATVARRAHASVGERVPVRVVFRSDGTDRDLIQGVRFGAGEMQHTARLLGSSLELVDVTPAEVFRPAAWGGATVVICGCNAGAIEADGSALVVLDASRASEKPACGPHFFRLGLTAEEITALTPQTGGVVEFWHESLYRFGAAQLNERYRRAYGRGMTSAAWLGWFAVKIAWESAQRTDGSTAALADYLLSPEAHFDGHKGAALGFNPATRWLVQPLHVVDGGTVTAEITGADVAGRIGIQDVCAQQ